MLDEVGLLGANLVSFPMEQNLKLTATKCELLKNSAKYRRLVGKLIYLTITRPNIQFSINLLSQFMHEPRKSYLNIAIRVLKCLKGSPGQCLFFPKQNNIKWTACSNVDNRSCLTIIRSIAGYCVFLRGKLVSWKTKKQSTVSRSP